MCLLSLADLVTPSDQAGQEDQVIPKSHVVLLNRLLLLGPWVQESQVPLACQECLMIQVYQTIQVGQGNL